MSSGQMFTTKIVLWNDRKQTIPDSNLKWFGVSGNPFDAKTNYLDLVFASFEQIQVVDDLDIVEGGSLEESRDREPCFI